MSGQQPADIAERVLLALTKYHVAGNWHAVVKIYMSPHDVDLLGWGLGLAGCRDVRLWGEPVNQADWVADGHPAVQITVTT